MLRKLMKYEFKATGRILLPLYGALLLFAFINRIIFRGSLNETIEQTFGALGSIASFISVFAYGCTMAAVFVVTFFVIVQRFYKNILGDEGYLMNTLPIKPYSNIISKIVTSVIWTIISCFVAFFSILIMVVTFDGVKYFFTEFIPDFSQVYNHYGIKPYLLFIEFCIAALVQLAKSIIMIYASMSIGHLFNKSKILFSFGAFIGLNILSNIINSIFMYIFAKGNFLIFNSSPSPELLSGFVFLSIIIELIYFAVYFFITNYILNHKLNLE